MVKKSWIFIEDYIGIQSLINENLKKKLFLTSDQAQATYPQLEIASNSSNFSYCKPHEIKKYWGPGLALFLHKPVRKYI